VSGQPSSLLQTLESLGNNGESWTPNIAGCKDAVTAKRRERTDTLETIRNEKRVYLLDRK
jgi:hypothetical protein